jgi:hypothetical protein
VCRPPWRPRRQPALLDWLYCPRSLSPKPCAVPRPPRGVPLLASRAGRPDGRPTDRRSVPCLPVSFAPSEAGARSQGCRRRSCGRKQARMSTIKWGCFPVRSAPSQNAHFRAPPGRHQSRHGEAGAGPPLNQLEHCFPSIPPCCSSPTCPPLPQSRHHAGIPVAAATAAGRPPLAGLLPAPSEPRNCPPRTQGSIPARARPVPAGGSPEFGRTAAGRCSGTALRSHNSF